MGRNQGEMRKGASEEGVEAGFAMGIARVLREVKGWGGLTAEDGPRCARPKMRAAYPTLTEGESGARPAQEFARPSRKRVT